MNEMWSEKSGDGGGAGGTGKEEVERVLRLEQARACVRVCMCVRLEGRRGERLNTNAAYETRNGEVLQ